MNLMTQPQRPHSTRRAHPRFRVALRTALAHAATLAFALLPVGLPHGAQAQTFTITAAAYAQDITFVEQKLFQAGTLSIEYLDYTSSSWDGGFGSASGSATATGGPGTLKAHVWADASAPVPPYTATSRANGQGNARVQYSDTLTISAPGLSGRGGTATASLAISGSANTSANGDLQASYPQADASASVSLFVGGEQTTSFESHLTIPRTTPDGYSRFLSTEHSGDIPPAIDLAFSFTYGTPFNLTIDLITSASAQARGKRGFGPYDAILSSQASADLDFGSSVYWDGLSGLTADGNPLAPGSFSVTSSSGVDYTQSFVPGAIVPEPAHYGLVVGAAIGGLALWRRRRLILKS